MKKIILFSCLILSSLLSNAQYVEDALKFSSSTINGTARTLGMGGVQNSIGGDISSLSGNPAGLGFYRKGDFSISPTLRLNSTGNTAFGRINTEGHSNFNIGNLGFVVTQLNQDYTGKDVTNDWVSYSFGIAANRTNSFKENSYFSGVNPNSSFSQYLAAAANDYYAPPTYLPDSNIADLSDMAWYGYMIDYDTLTNKYVSISNGNNNQRQSNKIDGYKNEWNFSFGANYSNQLYLGASVGVGSIEYSRKTKFTESGIVDPNYNVSEISLNEKHILTGSSVNLKVGLIYRPIDLIRVGASIQTPDYYSLNESFTTDLSSVQNGNSITFTPLEYLFEYRLITPFKTNLGLSIFFNKLGFLSFDLERLNYSKMSLDAVSGNTDFGPMNNAIIQNTFNSNTYNYRIGGEGKIGAISIRGGYALYGDPFSNSSIDQSKKSMTAGLGYKVEDYYLDVAFVNTRYESGYYPYYASNVTSPLVNTKNNINSVIVTVGTRF